MQRNGINIFLKVIRQKSFRARLQIKSKNSSNEKKDGLEEIKTHGLEHSRDSIIWLKRHVYCLHLQREWFRIIRNHLI